MSLAGKNFLWCSTSIQTPTGRNVKPAESLHRDGALAHGNHLLKTYSRTQSTIALSSGEAELYAMTMACSEALGLVAVAKDFGEVTRPIVHVDASAAIGIAQRKGIGRVRHLDTHRPFGFRRP